MRKQKLDKKIEKKLAKEEALTGKKFSANWKSENYVYFQFRDEFTNISEKILNLENGKILPESEEFTEQRAYTSHDQEEEVGSAKVD